ncbi:MAG: hypothetical protein H0T42_32700 [Deltaproteobacteria bacterium]|nr:hypothetical protein [Deltaproteobacteria bacterium]
MTPRLVSCVLLVAAIACDKGGGAAGNGPRDAVLAAWKKGGQSPSALTAASVPAVGKDCQSGTVGAIDVLLCVYPTAADAKAAEDAGLTWVGDTTGAAQASGTVLIAISDRRKSDPSGRTINQLMKLAPK